MEAGGEVKSGKAHYRLWKFGTVIDDEPKEFSVLLFPWEVADLLRACEQEETDKQNIFNWDPEDCESRQVRAELGYDDEERLKILRVKKVEKEEEEEQEEEEEEEKPSNKTSKKTTKKKEKDVPF